MYFENIIIILYNGIFNFYRVFVYMEDYIFFVCFEVKEEFGEW